MSPIPVFLSMLFLLFFSLPMFKKKSWSKVGRIISAIILIVSIIILLNWSLNSSTYKLIVSSNISHGVLVSQITEKIEHLIRDNEYEKAERILKTFNKEYPSVSHNLDELENLVSELLSDEFQKQENL